MYMHTQRHIWTQIKTDIHTDTQTHIQREEQVHKRDTERVGGGEREVGR